MSCARWKSSKLIWCLPSEIWTCHPTRGFISPPTRKARQRNRAKKGQAHDSTPLNRSKNTNLYSTSKKAIMKIWVNWTRIICKENNHSVNRAAMQPYVRKIRLSPSVPCFLAQNRPDAHKTKAWARSASTMKNTRSQQLSSANEANGHRRIYRSQRTWTNQQAETATSPKYTWTTINSEHKVKYWKVEHLWKTCSKLNTYPNRKR